MSRETVTTLIDLAALVLLAFGAGAAVFPLVGWAATAVAGVVLFGGARVIDWIGTPALAPVWWRRLRGDRT
ncbi:hypothetical protein [Umezawaea beigongshangensis]|uniref:hypothetical protein n=1 Tax=Umezawaea beigongshangensis TaxID=2780383 RepID=UPI0018F22286|nr:hypothetical protein [Umezawaea beigongshangensis]